ncbi:hypothetical protein Tco_0818112 [Tanacetum coccineum]
MVLWWCLGVAKPKREGGRYECSCFVRSSLHEMEMKELVEEMSCFDLKGYSVTMLDATLTRKSLQFITTQYQLVDIFTKPLNEPTFKILIVELDKITRRITFSLPSGYTKGDIGLVSFRKDIGANYLRFAKDYENVDGLEEFQDPSTTLQTRGSFTECSMLEAKKSRKKRPVRKKPPSTENDATFIGPFIKEATEAPKGLSKKKSSLAKDLNTRQPLVSILVPIDTTFVIVHSETASRGNASASLTTRADPSQYALNESLPQQEVDTNQFTGEGLEITFNQEPESPVMKRSS